MKTELDTIDTLSVGDIAYDNISDYAIVSKCVHGNKYYAYIAYNYDNTPYYIVSDMDTQQLTCCC